ncbi:hypothetical protein, partial [Marinibacterium profundimaris]
SQEALMAASPIYFVESNPNLPAFLIFVAQGHDKALPKTRAFHEALSARGAASKLFVIDGLSHREMGLALGEADSSISQKVLEMILAGVVSPPQE